MIKSRYDESFFTHVSATAAQSAAAVVPWLAAAAQPGSVLDVGCGEGAWLASFKDLGVDDVCGMDGHYVDRERLLFPAKCFQAVDLTTPFCLDREFDLALCLEVAEHLPPESAEQIVNTASKHASTVLFSAAIPLQGGTDHQNEQWPEYWINRFIQHGYILIDVVRPRFWNDDRVAIWYRQNIMLFVRPGRKYADQLMEALNGYASFQGKAVVHPSFWEFRNGLMSGRVGENVGPRQLLAHLPRSTVSAISRRLSRSRKQAIAVSTSAYESAPRLENR